MYQVTLVLDVDMLTTKINHYSHLLSKTQGEKILYINIIKILQRCWASLMVFILASIFQLSIKEVTMVIGL